MTSNWRSSIYGPIPPHPMYATNQDYLDAKRPVPRVRPEGAYIAEAHRGCLDLLFKMQALTTGGSELDRSRYIKPSLKKTVRAPEPQPTEVDRPTYIGVTRPAHPMPKQHSSTRPATPGRPRNSSYYPANDPTLSTTSSTKRRPQTPGPSRYRGRPEPEAVDQNLSAIDSDVRLIRAELESLKRRISSGGYDSPTPSEFDEAENWERDPRDWVERTRRRKEVEEEVTYRRSNGMTETYRRDTRNGRPYWERTDDRPRVTFRQESMNGTRQRMLRGPREEDRPTKEADKDDDPDRPPGYILVPDDERRQMLALMIQAENEIRGRYARIPVIQDTFRCRQEKKELEEAMDELQSAIAVYAQKKVYIKEKD